MKIAPYGLLVFLSIFISACKSLSGNEVTIDRAVLAYITKYSVPDSVNQDSVAVKIQGTIGDTEDYRFDRINTSRTDSLLIIAVWGRQVNRSGVNYAERPVLIDTTIIFTTPLHGYHYINIVAQQGVLVDTTFVR
jgi:hypothetical protein